MADSVEKLFPFSTLPENAVKITPVYLEFSAPIVGGYYVFSEATTPAKDTEISLPQGQKGVIAGIQISANCSPDDFAEAVEEPLLLQVLHGGNDTPINYKPFPFAQFSHGGEFMLNWRITAGDMLQQDSIKLAITGKVAQINNMSSNELVLKILFNFIRIEESGVKNG